MRTVVSQIAQVRKVALLVELTEDQAEYSARSRGEGQRGKEHRQSAFYPGHTIGPIDDKQSVCTV
jgi:hypothetical protein